MARKNVISSYKLFDNQAVTASAQSASIGTIGLDYASIAFIWSASDLVATLAVEVRNGEKDAWRELNLGSVPAISGSSGSHEIVLTQLPFTDLRLSISVSSGSSGLITATATAKSEGA